MPTLEARQLDVRFGSQVALRGVSLTLPIGVTALTGPNGSGKSTLVRVLSTLQRPQGGALLWEGQDVLRRPEVLRADLGYVAQDGGAYPHLTPVEFLQYMGAAKRLPTRETDAQIPELLAALNLLPQARRLIGSFSGGMRQRVVIAQALLGVPRLLILDEPTVGLDPEERERLYCLIRSYGQRAAVLLVTHLAGDLEACADRRLVLRAGEVAFSGPVPASPPDPARMGAAHA